MRSHRLIFLGLWILSLITISFYGGSISYGFFFCLTLLPFCCLLYLFFVYRSCKLYQKVESRNMVTGQPMPYFFVLQNNTPFAFSGISIKLFSSFSYVEELPGDVEYELLPKDKFTFKTRIVCKYRGEYEVGVKEIIITDFFRLFRIHYPVPGTVKAIVLPKIVRVKELVSMEGLAAFLQKETFLTQTEPDIVIRDYMDGDSFKQIHWKATAREQQLKIRNMTGEEKQGIAIFCDTNRCNSSMHIYLSIENKLLEILLALGVYFAEKSISFDVCFGPFGTIQTHVNNLQDFEVFYRKTSSISFNETENTADCFQQAIASRALLNRKVIFAVLHTLDSVILDLTEQLTATGTVVIIYLVTHQDAKDFVKQNSLRKRIIVLSPDDDLEGRL